MILARRAKHKEIKENILEIAKEAIIAKEKNKKVINATAGVLFKEDGELFTYQIVDEIYQNLSNVDKYYYAPTKSGERFKSSVLSWVFGFNNEHLNNYHIEVYPTPGASGAISMTIHNYLDFGEKLITQKYAWGTYKIMAADTNVEVVTFDNFDLKELDNVIQNVLETQDKVMILLNDPCNNPTGYSYVKKDYDNLVRILKKYTTQGIEVVLFLDVAYKDYYLNIDEYYENLNYLLYHFPDNALLVIGASGSKSFSIYGFRVGVSIGLTKTKELIEEFDRAINFSARARYSSVSNAGIGIINKIYSDAVFYRKYRTELEQAINLLTERYNIFRKQALKYKLDYIPYFGGFFICIRTNNECIVDELKKSGVYVIKNQDLIRIAISSVPTTELKRLVRIISKYV